MADATDTPKPKTCSVDGCSKKHYGRGMCLAHWKRWKRHGDPLGGSTTPGEPGRFIREATAYSEDGCLIWPFSRSGGGYAQINRGGKIFIVSRIVCEQVNGAPPSPVHEAAHSCGNGHLGCINPKHLSWKTPKENTADKVIHGTLAFGEAHPRAKLTEVQAREILAARGKATPSVLADKYAIAPKTVRDIQSGNRWASIHGGAA